MSASIEHLEADLAGFRPSVQPQRAVNIHQLAQAIAAVNVVLPLPLPMDSAAIPVLATQRTARQISAACHVANLYGSSSGLASVAALADGHSRRCSSAIVTCAIEMLVACRSRPDEHLPEATFRFPRSVTVVALPRGS